MNRGQCTRCGDCCKLSPCGICHALFGLNTDPCPALEHDGMLYSCGLVKHPCDFVDLGEGREWKEPWFGGWMAGLLGVGMGCCSSPDTELLHRQMHRARALVEVVK